MKIATVRTKRSVNIKEKTPGHNLRRLGWPILTDKLSRTGKLKVDTKVEVHDFANLGTGQSRQERA
eukprot:10343331-Heterocapsa_arctica.AAC.1